MLIPSLLSTLAHASSECPTPFSETEFRLVVGDAKRAIENGDVQAHFRASEVLRTQVPCLDQQLPTRQWADFLVTEALVRYANESSDWQVPLALALNLAPDHPDVPGFLIDEYAAPPPPNGQPQAIPSGRVIVLDGRVVVGEVPPLSGLHIAQVFMDDGWQSRVLIDQAVPERWLAPITPDIPVGAEAANGDLASWGTIGLGLGLGNWSQKALDADSDVFERETSGASLSLATHGQQNFSALMGAFWLVDVALQNGDGPLQLDDNVDPNREFGVFADAFAGLSVLDAPLSAWVGGGIATVQTQEEPGEQRPFIVPHYLVGISLRTQGMVPFDANVGGAYGPWAHHVQVRGGADLFDIGPLGFRAGAKFGLISTKVGDNTIDLADRLPLARLTRWTTSLQFGASWGPSAR